MKNLLPRSTAIAVLVMLCGLFQSSLCEGTGGLRFPRGPSDRQIQIPVRPGVPVPEGKQLTALYYQVTGDHEITLRRTLVSAVPFLGVRTTAVEERPAAGAEPFVGLRVTAVEAESPAARAGLVAEDVILELDGEPLGHPGRLSHLVRNHALDQPVLLNIQRGPRTFPLEVQLTTESVSTDDYEPIRLGTVVDPHAGFTFGSLDGRLRQYLVEPDESGVIVMSIRGGTPAFYSRVRVGDVLVATGAEATSDAEAFVSRLEATALAGDSFAVAIRRGPKIVQDSFRPLRSLPTHVSFKLPFLCDYKSNAEYTDLDLIWGILFDYDRNSDVFGTEHRQTRSWGALLNLIGYKRTPERKTFSLLWLIKLSW
ncbi:MAG: PDZ domain-containing protein [Planctomycetota bacterium]